MFKSLGLFSSLPCPVDPCELSGCLFKHPEKKCTQRPVKRRKLSEAQISSTSASTSQSNIALLGLNAPKELRNCSVATSLSDFSTINDPNIKHKGSEVIPSTQFTAHTSSTKSLIDRPLETPETEVAEGNYALKGTDSASCEAHSSHDLKEPEGGEVSAKASVPPKSDPRYVSRVSGPQQISIKFDPMCKVPHESRLHYLRLYKAQFERIYAAFEDEIFQKLVSEHAIEQEKSVVSKNGKGTYKQASRNALVALNKREIARDQTDVGIHPTYKPPMKNVVDWSLFVHTPKTLHAWGYTTRVPEPDTCAKNEAGCDRTCDRCTQRFIVTEDKARWLTCTYHPGKSTYKNEGGARVTTWTCCGSNSGAGCTTALSHVFKINHAPRLAAYSPYVVFPEPDSQRVDELDVVALDCEMVYTTASMELARISITSKGGEVILDRYIAPENCVLDLNTRYSGITQKALKDHAISRSQLFEELSRLGITKGTIIIGHGLENDLTALRIVHLHVIDSAILFPHPRGRPYRNGLKYLTKRYLNKDIQMNSVKNDGAELVGHDPAEDARSALELVLWKAAHGKEKVGDEPFMGKLK